MNWDSGARVIGSAKTRSMIARYCFTFLRDGWRRVHGPAPPRHTSAMPCHAGAAASRRNTRQRVTPQPIRDVFLPRVLCCNSRTEKMANSKTVRPRFSSLFPSWGGAGWKEGRWPRGRSAVAGCGAQGCRSHSVHSVHSVHQAALLGLRQREAAQEGLRRELQYRRGSTWRGRSVGMGWRPVA